MAQVLLDLPDELLVSIVEQLDGDRRTLCTLSLVSKRFQALSEALLYSSIFYRHGFLAERILEAVKTRLDRGAAIRSLESRMHPAGSPEAHASIAGILRRAPRLQEAIIESPYCNHERWRKAEARTRWGSALEKIFQPFVEGSAIAAQVLSIEHQPSQKPLQSLSRLTLHLNGAGREFWTVEARHASIFALPALQDLHISSANILASSTSLMPSTFRSSLKRLTLDECNLTMDGLKNLMAVPAALEYLYIGENHYSPEEEDFPTPQPYNELCRRDPEAFISAIAQQKHSLTSFVYDAKQNMADWSVTPTRPQSAGSGFSNFEKLSDMDVASPNYFLTSLFISSDTAPPNLKSIRFAGIEMHGVLFEELQQARSAHAGDDFAVPALIRRIVAAAPKLEEIAITFDRIAGDLEEELREPIQITGKYLQERKINFRLLQQPTRFQLVRPQLFGEELRPDELIYANDGTEFTSWRAYSPQHVTTYTLVGLDDWEQDLSVLDHGLDQDWEDIDESDETNTETDVSEDENAGETE
ncbi:hypothetical protein BTJ68_06311 [Hortaea werneckii EXF-2000]|uniref:F-box domain-containing protein n=2 Tax=Hortaea werneckii TaxID=91943 RepID=A0A3M7ILH1_HORWE|nr:hypothetical protein BTJ68_06311 [Hortaea werneckii EXF-2000]RMZ26370.1 hypothetical protein D0859_09557 [Hortaea werneckii]